MEVYNTLRDIGFNTMVLTKGPHKTTTAWTEKVDWVRDHLGAQPVTITEDKGLVYGRVLFDDWPPYMLRWLEWRPRGLGIMLDAPSNIGFTHPNVVKVRMNNPEDMEQMRVRAQEAFDR